MKENEIAFGFIHFTVFFLLSPENNLADAQRELKPLMPQPLPPPPTSYVHRKLNPSIAIAIVVIICALFLTVLFTILRHCGELNDEDEGAGSHPFSGEGLDPSAIETFPIFVYAGVKDLKIGKEDLECAICLSEFKDDDTMRFLPKCHHVFHPYCIDAWLSSHVTCPVCRANLSLVKNAGGGSTESTEVDLLPDSTRPSETQNQIAIDVHEEINETQELDISSYWPVVRETGKFPRSHSTGHSLVQLGENTERYTLRLSEEVRKQLMTWGKLKRTRSYDVFWVKGCHRSGGEESSRGKRADRPAKWSNQWVFTMTPPFVFREKLRYR